MADTSRSRSALLTLLADNTTGQITAQVERDFLVSVMSNMSITTLTSGTSYTPTLDDCVIVASSSISANFTVNLPAAATAGWSGKVLHIKKEITSDYTLTVDANASEKIDGQETRISLVQYSSMTIICDGSNWHII